MKRMITQATFLTMLYAGNVFAAGGSAESGFGFWGLLFLGFLAAILAWQLLPGLVLFGATLKGLFQNSTDQGKSSLTKQ